MKTITHTHWESAYDAVPNIKKMFDRLEELGVDAIAVTDHGSLNAIADVWEENNKRKNPLNIIYGCELYVKHALYDADDTTAHMIIMAKNQIGKRGVDKLLYAANHNLNKKDQPVVTYEMIESLFGKNGEFFGTCIFTTACIQGVPSLFLLSNSRNERKMKKLSNKIAEGVKSGKMLDPKDGEYKKLGDSLEESKAEVERLSALIKENKALAGKKNAAILKRANSAKAKGFDEKANELFAEAKAIEDAAAKATEALKTLEPSLKVNQNLVKEKKAELDATKSAIEKFSKADKELKRLEGELVDEGKLYGEAKASVKELSDMIGSENLFLEIQYHGLSSEKYCYSNIIKIAKELGLNLIAANDSHMVDNSNEEFTRRAVAKFLRYNSLFDEDEESEAAEHEYYLKDDEELREWLLKVYPEAAVEEAIRNMNVMGAICKVSEPTEPHYPVYDKNVDAKELIRKMAYDGIPEKFAEGEFTDEYKARLEYELDIICSMGYADYHLVVADFIKYGLVIGQIPSEKLPEVPLSIEGAKEYCKSHGYDAGLGIGPGRGSAAGSLTCFLLGITNVDPIKYNLKFERFLNPERYSMPDIDVDLSPYVREKVVDYVTNRYGEKATCRILTKNYEWCKGAIRDAARYYGTLKDGENDQFLALGNSIRKSVPATLNIRFDDPYKDGSDESVYDFLLGLYGADEDARDILYIAKCIEGAFFSYGIHAAGVVISDGNDIADIIPLRYSTGKKSEWTTCCTKEQVEHEGLLKMDFLGLKNLNIITDALMMIKKNHGLVIDALNLPIEKEVIEKIFADGKTIGVFQFESAGMRKYLKKMHPTGIEDLFIMNAMYRPGPLQFIDMVCDVKNGLKQPEYLCPELEPILGVTYSAIVYQEQVMQICTDLAGYTMGQADMVRKYMSKKKAEPLKAERKSFVYGDKDRNIVGCVGNGIAEDVANKIFDQMMDFASYAFNKSHAAAYSIVAYTTGYLKYHYPTEYFCALLNWTDDVSGYLPIISEARAFGVEVLPPDINHSKAGFSTYNGKILFGLGAIKGIGKGADVVIENRKEASYLDFKDFLLRSGAGAKVTSSLIACGAFDSLGYTRAQLSGYVHETLDGYVKTINKAASEIEKLKKGIDVISAHEDISTVPAMQKAFDKEGVDIKITSKGVPTADGYRKRVINQEEKKAIAEAELRDFEIKYVSADKAKDLAAEKLGMGIYLTGHPTDGIVLKEGQNRIMDIDEDDSTVTGVITEVTTRYNKKKKPWYTFVIEDATGYMSGVCFDSSMEGADLIKEGNIVTISGVIEKDDFKSTDDDIIYQIQTKKISEAKSEVKKTFIWDFKTKADFDKIRDSFVALKDESGISVRLYFEDICQFTKEFKLNGQKAKEFGLVC